MERTEVALRAGDILGDYRLLQELGRGALGSSYLAEHRFIKKPCVLKILPPELSEEPTYLRRFEEEIKHLAQLHHPHIVKVHNVSYAEGFYFLVTDFISDASGHPFNLAIYLASAKAPFIEEELLYLVYQIAHALDALHMIREERPLLHGSLKLSNVLLKKGAHGLEAFLCDAGLSYIIGVKNLLFRSISAKAKSLNLAESFLKEESSSPYDLEDKEVALLTQSFLQGYASIAPELLEGSASPSIASDTYAFGVLLHYLIWGSYPQALLERTLPAGYLYSWLNILVACLQRDPQHRPLLLVPLLEKMTQRAPPERSAEEILPLAEEPREIANLATALPLVENTLYRLVTSDEISTEAPSLLTSSEEQSHAEEAYEKQLNQMLHREPVVMQYQPQQMQRESIQPILSPLISLKGGTFERGNNTGARDEMPRHSVILSPFAIESHPVTNEQFVQFLDFMGGEKDNAYHDLIRLKDARIKRIAGRLVIESGYAKHPVVGVTWYGAMGYAKWMGRRLPTEAEWEIAAMAGNAQALYPTGENIEKREANFFTSDTTPVKTYPPNSYGIYDMAGNVYEWCSDWYGYNYYEYVLQEPQNPKGPHQGVYRVLRGGCWKSLKDDLRVAHRHRNNPGASNSTYGFRCVVNE